MRRIVLGALLAFAALLGVCGRASAETPPIVTDDPAEYAQVFADSMAVSGIRPVRQAFEAMLAPSGGALPADAEAALIVYERANLHTPALVSRVIDDVVLGDAFRVIYLYHYFGGNGWVFTRLDFVRIGQREWALSRLAFGDRWSTVALTPSPGFTPVEPSRR
jgi:hypothetical protein